MKTIKYIGESFSTLAGMISTIDKRQPNKVFAAAGVCASTTGGNEYSGGASYEDAGHLAITGVASLAREIIAKAGKLNNNAAGGRRAYACVTGFAPIVPNALAGIPESMINYRPRAYAARVIKLVYGITADAAQTADEITSAGAKVVNAIESLERRDGVRVELWANFTAQKDEKNRTERVTALVCLKQAQQPFNRLKIAYPFAHAAFLRRHLFRWLETVDGLKCESFPRTYGRPIYNAMELADIIKSTKACAHVMKGNAAILTYSEAKRGDADEVYQTITRRAGIR